ADLSIDKTDGKAGEGPGTSVTYTITVTNGGPTSVTSPTVSGPMPAATTFVSPTGGATYESLTNTVHVTPGTLAPTAASTYELTLDIDPTATGTLSNTASVAPPSGPTDPNNGNNSSTDTDTLVPVADLSIAKSDGATSAKPGTNTTYTVTVT